jgi:membrane associated rhomboid family serine protease
MSAIEVFRSPGFLACEQRSFVLHAVGIPSEIVDLPEAFVLYVAPEAAVAAREHIERFNTETEQAQQPSAPPPVLHRHAWASPALFALTIVGVAYLAGIKLARFDWYEAGALRVGLAQSGEWWRVVTALTLHADHAHLLGNLGFGAFFGFLAARLLGSGVALATTLAAAILGNVLDSALMPSSHTSIGASTWVFATLGLVSAYAWRLQVNPRLKWAHRSAPLVAGVMLLALIGAGGENTDVLAHLTGFVSGVLFGALYAKWQSRPFASAVIQWLAGIVAIGVVAGAWNWARYGFSG